MDLHERSLAVAALRDLIRSGLPLRAALCAWPDAAPPSTASELRKISRCVALTGDIDRALAMSDVLGSDSVALSAICSAHEDTSLELCSVLGALASAIEARAEERGSARAAIAGAKLQARLVASLPLVALLLAPAAHVALFDATGLVTTVVGGMLVAVGMKWMAALVPDIADSEDAVTLIAEMTAAACDAGASIAVALSVALNTGTVGVREPARRAARLLAIGYRPAAALEASGEESLQSMATVIARAQDLGTPTSAVLRTFAARRRDAKRVAFETALKKAPVRMVVPLTLCVLPAFAVVGITPFLRGLANG
ncbi:MAG: type II secretion system F family protein [Actinomycetota bacterium]|nr:type II secretion system F family protein [Actinomycetota bacterium]